MVFFLPIFAVGIWENASNTLTGIKGTKQCDCLSFSIFSLDRYSSSQEEKIGLPASVDNLADQK